MRFLVLFLVFCLPALTMAQNGRTASAKKPVKRTAVASTSKNKKPSAKSRSQKGKRHYRSAPARPAEAVKRDRFVRLVKLAPWSDAATMAKMIQPAVALRAKASGAALPVGEAKLGGQADLPPGLDWPKTAAGQPMALLAQLDLSQFARFDSVTALLPKQGFLYFFGWFAEDPAAGELRDVVYKRPDEYRVLYYDGARADLQRRDWPAALPQPLRFAALRAHPTLVHGLPSCVDWRLEGLRLPERDLVRLQDFSSMYGVEEDHLLGYAYPLQDDPLRDFAMAQLTLHPPLTGEQEQRVEARRREFVHLLTLELAPNFEAAGTARAFWGIRREDLMKRDFSKAIMVLQDVNAVAQRR